MRRMCLEYACFLLVCAATVPLATSTSCAVEKSGDQVTRKTALTTDSTKSKPFLGLNVVNLNTVIGKSSASTRLGPQGVLVEDVHPESPAAQAGIRQLDVLLSYDDQKLFNCDQMIKLIAMDEPGREIKIQLIRNEKEKTVRVKLADRPSKGNPPQTEVFPRDFPRFDTPEWQPRKLGHQRIENLNPTSWERIESLVIKRLGHDRFRASLSHTASDDQLIEHEYEGTRDELRKIINTDENLKTNERQQLLQTLGSNDDLRHPELLADDVDTDF